MIGKVKDMVRSAECFAKHILETNLKGNRSKDSQAVMDRRCPLNHGWIKINIDGVTNRNGNWSTIGVYYETILGIELKDFKGLLGGIRL